MEKILDFNVEENEIPPFQFPTEITFYCDPKTEIPDLIKRVGILSYSNVLNLGSNQNSSPTHHKNQMIDLFQPNNNFNNNVNNNNFSSFDNFSPRNDFSPSISFSPSNDFNFNFNPQNGFPPNNISSHSFQQNNFSSSNFSYSTPSTKKANLSLPPSNETNVNDKSFDLEKIIFNL